ncbi:putative methyltransferase NSUN6 [Ipomoea triloba]|uniref:putative methyltransferase NSUN6 n=1 Tax=Ipomoea triloba TaxID=35885 RepID=UPI00125CE691|nr:putative methyltransferase NSUN6 [Ipomoea triloba]
MQRGRHFLKTFRRASLSLSTTHQMEQEARYSFNPSLRWNPEVEDYFTKAYGAEHFARISTALTRPSCYSCIRVNTLKSTSDNVIQKLLKILRERRQENGSVEKRLELSGSTECTWPIESISKCPFPGLDYVVFIKGSGPHDIDYGCKEGKPPKEVIVSRKCAEAVLRGAQVFVPGVLACSAHVEKGDVVAVSVAVEQPGPEGGWGIGMTRGTVLQGSPTDPLYFERNGLYIGQGTTMLSRAGIFRVPQGVAVDMHNRVFELPSFNELLEGEIFLQNLPSIIAAHALDPQPGERILDMCAAPGGKTTAIAILMKDKGEIVAADRSHNKVLDIKKLAAEMDLNCITTYKLDALKACRRTCEDSDLPILDVSDEVQSTPSDPLGSGMDKTQDTSTNGLDAELISQTKSENVQTRSSGYTSKAELRKSIRKMRNGPGRNHCSGGRVEKSKGFAPNSFDRVLLDAPCSALGLRPRLFAGEETVESLRNHGKYQRRMFDQAVQLVRPGGVLVYSTCTINPGENEALVRYALDTYKFLSLAEQHPRVGGPGLTGCCQFPDGYTEEWLKPGEEDFVQRFDPSSPLDTIGFFIAKFNVGSESDSG